MAQPNRTKTALLGFLTWGPMSGYDIGQLIQGSISYFWSEGFGRIYPMLSQLAKDGLATRVETRSDGGRPRNVFEITAKGRDELTHWLREPTVPRPVRDERLLKLFFGARTDPGASRDQIEAHRAEFEGSLESYREVRDRLESLTKPPPDQRFWLMTLRHGELVAEANLRWCEEVLEEIHRIESAHPKETPDESMDPAHTRN